MNKLMVSFCALSLCLISARSHAEPASSEEESPAVAQTTATAVKKGDVATVPGEGQVEVANLDPVKDKMSPKLSFGDACNVQYGSEVKVVAVDEDLLLVEYKRSPNARRADLECPNGTLLLVETEIFTGLTEKYNQLEKEKKERLEQMKTQVKKMLGKK